MNAMTGTGVRCSNHRERTYHTSVAEVRACFQTSGKGVQRVENLDEKLEKAFGQPTIAQLDEWREREFDAEIQRREREEDARVAAYKMQQDTLYPGTTPATTDRQYVRAEEQRGAVTQDGMYRNPETGEIYKVQWNRGSGDGKRLYAKQLILSTFNQDGTDARILYSIPLSGEKPGMVQHDFRYAPGAMRFIRAEWRMTIEEAKQFGALYGTCIRCGRTLTLEESIERAMGSTCARKANWA